MKQVYLDRVKALAIALLSLALAACSAEKIDTTSSAPRPTDRASTSQPTAETAPASDESSAEPVSGVWAGQVKIDAHRGVATLNYVGSESGDFVPMRFGVESEVGAKILAQCADEDLCEFTGTVRFLDEPPPENASAVGEIVRVVDVKKLPPDAR